LLSGFPAGIYGVSLGFVLSALPWKKRAYIRLQALKIQANFVKNCFSVVVSETHGLFLRKQQLK